MILRILGGLLVLVLAAVCAIVEVLYLPLRAGSVLLPLSIVAAVAGNVAFTRAMYEVVGSIWPALLPGAVWLAVIARSSIARPEGDLLISDGGSSTALAMVNLAFLLLGALALAFAVGTLRRPKRTQGVPESIDSTQGTPATLGTYQSFPDRSQTTGQPPDTAGRR